MLGYVLVAVLAMAFGCGDRDWLRDEAAVRCAWSVRGGMERGLSRSRAFGDPATWN